MSEPSDTGVARTHRVNLPPRQPRPMDRVELLALRAVAAVVSALGVDRASAAMGRIWRLLAPLNRRHARADQHLAMAMPHLSAADRRRILADMWDNLGRTAAETLLLPRIIADPDRFEIASDLLAAHRADLTGGAIFASLHMGNWELAGWGIRLAGFKVAAVYRPLTNPLVETFVRQCREPVYDAGLLPRDASTAFRLRTLARQGVAVGMLADLRDPSGVEVPFFGRPALANSLPVVFARRLGLPLIVGRIVRKQGVAFCVEATRVAIPRTDDTEADVRAGTAALTAQFESWIRDKPGQWMWAHRKWVATPTASPGGSAATSD